MGFEYIKSKQKEWDRKARIQEELRAEREAERIAKMEAAARKQAAALARERRLLKEQESERLRQEREQRQKIIAEEKWGNQCDLLVAQIKDHLRKDNKLEEIRFIVHNRDPTLQILDWADWLSSDPLNQRLADLDIEHAMEMFKRDNLMAARRGRTRGKKVAIGALAFGGAEGNRSYLTTDFNPDTYNLNLGFTVSYWVRPDEVGEPSTDNLIKVLTKITGWNKNELLDEMHDSETEVIKYMEKKLT